MFSSITSGAIHGIGSYLIQVEVDASKGLPCFQMVGLLGSEVREARERVKVALKNADLPMPPMSINVNLSPADIHKGGALFDLPVAVGILSALEYLPQNSAEDTIVIGELGLNGEVKPVKGVLPIVTEAKRQGLKRCILPKENASEGAVVQDIEIIGVTDIKEVLEYLRADVDKRSCLIQPAKIDVQSLLARSRNDSELDFVEVNGQEGVKRAAQIAAAGFHHLLIVGPPGSGKTMIAKRIPTILPPMSLEESMEVSSVYSISGLLSHEDVLITRRPFIAPHHTITRQALAGGGKMPLPGMITLAHRGVLFLDELPEFKRENIDILRQPLEDRNIQIARNSGSYIYPADFMLVGAMNPCPCGYYPDVQKCRCTPYEIHRYLERISGPILDRIDICVEAPALKMSELSSGARQESSAQMREHILAARKIQQKRFEGTRLRFNADMGVEDIRKHCKLGLSEERLMESFFHKLNLTARSYHRVLKVARTIADLAGDKDIREQHLTEALCYRVAELGKKSGY